MDSVAQVIIEIITAATTIICLLIKTSHSDKKTEKMVGDIKHDTQIHHLRSEMMDLISQDQIAVLNKKLPSNFKDVHNLYDEYQKIGGNSYIHRKIDEYDAMICEYENKMAKKSEKTK